MKLVLVSILNLLLVATTAAADKPTKHPLEAADRAKIAKQLQATVDESTKLIAQDPEQVQPYSSRADAYFFLGEFKKAVDDYEKTVELQPRTAASHWRRGIAYFYNKQYKKAANQFEMYHTFDDVDRENGIWRYFSQYKAYGMKKAREGLLKYKKTDREPFPAVYKLFAGEMTPKEILAEIDTAKIGVAEREKRLFYAELYIGLNEALEGRNQPSMSHLHKSVGNNWGRTSGFGPNYMWHVGRLHYDLLAAEKPKDKQPANYSRRAKYWHFRVSSNRQ